jgi:hypothetical protein
VHHRKPMGLAASFPPSLISVEAEPGHDQFGGLLMPTKEPNLWLGTAFKAAQARIFGPDCVHFTCIDGVDVTKALEVVSESCTDMVKFPSDKHFASWLGLCPGTMITGGELMSGKTKPCANQAAQALRLATAAQRTSQPGLGSNYRRLCARIDKAKAVTAAPHKLARLVYPMLTQGEKYIDRGQVYYEECHRQHVLHNLGRRA